MKGPNPDQGRAPFLFYLAWGIALLSLVVATGPEESSGFRFSTLGTLRLSAGPIWISLALISIFCGAAGLARPWSTAARRFFFRINLFGIVLAILLWAGLGRRIDLIGLAAQSLRLAAPIALGAMAGILCEKSGVINIAIEGLMLTAACVGFTAALYSGNVWIGLAAAVLSAMAMAGLHAFLSIHLAVDQIISGTAINILAVGGTGFIRRAFLTHGPREAPGVFDSWPLPWLSDLPAVGRAFFNHQPLVYAMVLSAILLHIGLYRTRWGLRTRMVGEHPRAADTVGAPVLRLRYLNVILGGAPAGLGGAWFSLETVGRFDELMTGGKGFISLAAMIFGQWKPIGALGGALLFGSADALQIKLQISGVWLPYQFLGMLPYVLTMIVLAGLVGRARPPAAIGQPYIRE